MAFPKGGMHSEATKAEMSRSRQLDRHPRWKGDEAKKESVKARGRRMARKKFQLPEFCETAGCDAPATDRHHKDGDTDNNKKRNIAFLCHPCHITVDNPQYKRS